MRSMIYQKTAGGSVKVHKKDTVDKIVDDGIREKTELDFFVKKRPKHIRRQGPRALSAPASTASLGSGSRSNQSAKTQDWLNESTIIELQKKAINESHDTKQLYTNFMETERTFVKSLEDYLTHKEFTDLRKKELLHKRWTEEVYEPIRKKILDTIDKSDRNEIDYLKREKHRRFLEHLNKKGVVFLDDDDKEEPSLEAVNSLSKVKTKPLLDPLHTESRQRAEDEKTILLCMTGQHYTDSDLKKIKLPLLTPGARSVAMPCYSIENVSRNKNRSSVYGNKTSFDFRSWAAEGYDAKMAAQELQIPHKRMFAEHPPFGKPPVVLPKIPFIDPEDFADKIINTNPFNLHMANLKAEVEAMKEFAQIQQQADVEQKELQNQDNQQKIQPENHEQLFENSHNQQIMESDHQQQMENNQ